MKRTASLQRSAADYLPKSRMLGRLAKAAHNCKGCELYKRATQVVFGEGSSKARVVVVGEQPGDREDLQGRPFVGPAGALLDEILVKAGMPRDEVYVTNAVKHFKWTARGKRRLHGKPSSRELSACRPWLDAELQAIEPAVIVCLGASAARSLLGAAFRLTMHLGEFQVNANGAAVIATYHPAAVLRAPTADARYQMRKQLVADFRRVVRRLRS